MQGRTIKILSTNVARSRPLRTGREIIRIRLVGIDLIFLTAGQPSAGIVEEPLADLLPDRLGTVQS
ncbi:hypothetical protein CK489_39640 [Bradyrhizobium sp. UFLA03-84]|nr:hypothetical protein CK489_39640 [Bradyrhizobium sp. UFLA03-84]